MKGNLRLLGGQKIKSPSGFNTRPTTSLVRESLINIIGQQLRNSSLLDLFSGSGIISCEAIQRGAKKVFAIESDKKTAQICSSNLALIANGMKSSPEIYSINYDVLKWLKLGHNKQKEKYKSSIPSNGFDFVYLDPPYAVNYYSIVLKSLIEDNWIKERSLVICESSNSINLETSNDWLVKDQRIYGKSKLTFLTPNLE